ncbi:MAG: acyl-CoA synthetase [Kangiellaceae bacterium]|nr:acyl-CoA synthetase [Kangiellaceae bacterium]
MMSSLISFKNLLLNGYTHTVSFSDHNDTINHQQFLHDLSFCIRNIKRTDYKRFVLYCTDSYQFLVNFIALSICKKIIIITANDKPLWLNDITQYFDCIITDNISQQYAKPSLSSKPVTEQPSGLPVNFDITGIEETQVYFFTSGSSGNPKSIKKSLKLLLNEIDIIQQTFKLPKTHSIYASVSHQHIYGLLFRLLWPFLQSRPFSRSLIQYPEQLIELCINQDTVFVSSPAFLSRLDDSLPTIHIDTIFSSGGPLSFNAAQQVQQLLGTLPIEVYGSTETGGIGYRQQNTEQQHWTLFDDVYLTQVGKQQTVLTSGHIFESSLELDDHLQLLGERQFLLQGRKDRIIKLEEKRISLDEIEHHLQAHPHVKNAKVIVLHEKRQYLAAVVQLDRSPQDPLLDNEKAQWSRILKHYCNDKYQAITVPRKWRFVDQLPYNTQGKLLLNELEQLFKSV